MKTIAKTLIAISVLMISLQVIAGGNQTTTGKVHYKVQIHLPKDIPFKTKNIFVVMTDGNNKTSGFFLQRISTFNKAGCRHQSGSFPCLPDRSWH